MNGVFDKIKKFWWNLKQLFFQNCPPCLTKQRRYIWEKKLAFLQEVTTFISTWAKKSTSLKSEEERLETNELGRKRPKKLRSMREKSLIKTFGINSNWLALNFLFLIFVFSLSNREKISQSTKRKKNNKKNDWSDYCGIETSMKFLKKTLNQNFTLWK